MSKFVFGSRGAMFRKKLEREPFEHQKRPTRVGRWTVLGHDGEYWPCRCDCGTERNVAANNLRTGGSQSCGCARKETLRAKATKHGLSCTAEYRRHYVLENWGPYLATRARTSARRKGLPCDLENDDVIVPTHCPVLGIPLRPSFKCRTDATPTLDRIVPELGYTKGNVVVVSWRANRLKMNASFSELANLYRFYVLQGADAKDTPEALLDQNEEIRFGALRMFYHATLEQCRKEKQKEEL